MNNFHRDLVPSSKDDVPYLTIIRALSFRNKIFVYVSWKLAGLAKLMVRESISKLVR